MIKQRKGILLSKNAYIRTITANFSTESLSPYSTVSAQKPSFSITEMIKKSMFSGNFEYFIPGVSLVRIRSPVPAKTVHVEKLGRFLFCVYSTKNPHFRLNPKFIHILQSSRVAQNRDFSLFYGRKSSVLLYR